MRITQGTGLKKNNHGITEVIGTMLLLIISISLFSVVYLSVYTLPDPTQTPSANIIGTLDPTTDQIRFYHLGGSSIPGYNTLRVQKGNTVDIKEISSYVGDEWELGEVITYDITNYHNIYVDASVIDVDSNSIISNAVLQKGFSEINPYVRTRQAKNIEKESATLSMDYDFVTNSGIIYFSYREKGTSTWINTSTIAKSGWGSYDKQIISLTNTTTYEYRGIIKFGSTILQGSVVEFSTASIPLDTMVDDLPDVISSTPFTINATGDSELDNVTLYYRYSNDGVTWYDGDDDVNWWNSSWSERLHLSIDHRFVSGTLANFTALVKLSDPSLSNHAQNDADDIVFIDENNHQLPHEIDSYDSATGTLVAWVKLPVLSHTENTTFWLYYSNPISGNQEQVEDAWDDSFVAVYHLDSMIDSTNNPHNLIDQNTNAATGMVGGCRYFSGNDQSYLHVTSPDFDLPNSFTVSCWYYTNASDTQQKYATLLNKQDNSNKHNWLVSFTHPKKYSFLKSSTETDEDYIEIDTGYKALEDDEWHHVSASYDATNGLAELIICGGAHIVSDSSLGFTLAGQSCPFIIGKNVVDTNQYFKGLIDEVYVSNVQRDLNWTNTYYNNIINKSSFTSIIPSGGLGWTKWDSTSTNPDETSPWSWEFPFSEYEGYYEFISIGQFQNNTEIWPESTDQLCEYDI